MGKWFILLIVILSVFIPANVLADVTYRDTEFPVASLESFSSHRLHINGIVWLDSTIGYFIQNHNTGAINIYKTTNGGAAWNFVGEVAAAGNGITGSSHSGPSIWFDKWTPGDTGTRIHIAWVLDSSGTGNFRYRPFDTAIDTFPFAIQTIFTQFDANSIFGHDRNHVAIVKQNNTLYYYAHFRSARYLRSSTNGTVWSSALSVVNACPNASDNMATALLPDPQDTNRLWNICKTSLTNLSFRSYSISGNAWTDSHNETVISHSSSFYNPVDAIICDSDIYVSASGNEGTLHGSLSAEFFRLDTGTVTVLGDMLPGSTANFFGSGMRMFCSGKFLYGIYSYKPAALDASSTYNDNTTFPHIYFLRHKIVPFGLWSTPIQINEPTQDVPVYLPVVDANTIPVKTMIAPMIVDGTARILPIWDSSNTNSLANNYGKNIIVGVTTTPVAPETESNLADNLRNMLSWIGIDDALGYLGFAATTTLALMVILFLTGAPFFMNGIIGFIWFSSVIVVLVTSFAWLAFWLFALLLIFGVFIVIRMLGGGKANET